MRLILPKLTMLDLKRTRPSDFSASMFMRALVLGTLAVALVAGARLWSRNLRAADLSATSSKYDSVESQANSNRDVQALPIQLKFHGFFPREIQRPAGFYYLTVGNVSREKEMTLRFDRQGGERMFDVNLTRQRPWRQTVFLAPGTYFLTEANHPQWECRITITAP